MFDLSFFGVLLVLAALGLAIRNMNVIGELRRRLADQERAIAGLRRTVDALRPEPKATAAPLEPPPVMAAQAQPPATAEARESTAAVAPAAAAPPASPPEPPAAKTGGTLERQFGGRAFVWLGGVALALAGFFLVKYSIDIGLLTESVRVVLGLVFGVALLAGSQAVRARKGLADGVRIAQALAGAGIADLYGSLFAATTLYHLVPSWMGFAAMAVVTAVALVLSLRHGIPIAVLGLAGGYATPLLIQGDPNAPVLFGYLYLVFGGLSLVIRRQGWRWLALPAALVAFAWVGLWIASGRAAQDGAPLSLFLLGLGATAALIDRGAAATPMSAAFLLRNFAPAGALVLMASVTYATHFSLFEWSVFGLFSAGAIALGFFDHRSFMAAPWLAVAADLVLLGTWLDATPASLAIAIAAFATLFTLAGLLLLDRAESPPSWAALGTLAPLAFFLQAYQRLGDPLRKALGGQADMVWALLAFAAAALLAVCAFRRFVLAREVVLRHILRSIFAGGATAFATIGLLILPDKAYDGLAIAAEMLAVAWLVPRLDIPALRWIAMALAGLFGLLLIPELGRLVESTATGFGIAPPDIVSIIVFTYALPAALFTASSLFLRQQKDDPFVQIVELLTIALTGLGCYRIVEYGFEGSPATLILYSDSIFDNVLLLLSLAALGIAARFDRIAALWGAAALGGCAVLRIALFGLLLGNPLWTHVLIGAAPLVNGLLLAYGLPAAIGLLLARDLGHAGFVPAALGARIASFVMAFIYITFSVRQVFTGAYLDGAGVSDAEIYAYSAVWLVTGVALLFAAVWRGDMTMRIGSLIVLLLTVGKVFLYDASALTGLWRVVSFLGLGLSLLGLSWFYSRFVFVSERATEGA